MTAMETVSGVWVLAWEPWLVTIAASFAGQVPPRQGRGEGASSAFRHYTHTP